MQRVFLYCREKIATEDIDAADDAATVLEEGRGTPLGCARAMIALCRGAKIPSRPVAGFIVEAGDHAIAHVWVEVWMGDRWVSYDPVNGYEKELPTDFVPARRGEDQVVIARGMRDLEVEYDIEQLPKASLGTNGRGPRSH